MLDKIKLILDNINIKLENLPEDINKELYDKLSYEIYIYQSDTVYKRHLYSKKTHKTYAGFYDYVIELLNEYEVDYELIDNRIKPQQNADYEIVEPFKLRDYQQEVVNNCREREIIQAATGAGKTVMMAGIIAKFKTKPVAIFADKLSLCTQLQSEISKFLGVEVGLVGGGKRDVKDITVYSAQSTTDLDVANANMILFDECFTGDTLVSLGNDMYMTIKEIVKKQMPLNVPSYNIQTKTIEYKPIINYGKKENKEKIYKITIEDEEGKEHIITCTENHKIFADNEYIKAKDLKIAQEVIVL